MAIISMDYGTISGGDKPLKLLEESSGATDISSYVTTSVLTKNAKVVVLSELNINTTDTRKWVAVFVINDGVIESQIGNVYSGHLLFKIDTSGEYLKVGQYNSTASANFYYWVYGLE